MVDIDKDICKCEKCKDTGWYSYEGVMFPEIRVCDCGAEIDEPIEMNSGDEYSHKRSKTRIDDYE